MRVNYRMELPEIPGIFFSVQEKIQDGITQIHVHMERREAQAFGPMTLRLLVPAWDIQYIWTPKIHLIKALNLDWFLSLQKNNGFTGAPVACLIGNDNENRACVALSETIRTIRLFPCPVEETGEYGFEIGLFEQECTEETYDLILRLDTRKVPYYESLSQTCLWWEKDERNTPAFVPQDATEPMYSTWYSFHQNVTEEELLVQCRLAQKLGLKTLLVDDGWQTDDNHRGYAFCGDWKPAPGKIPDMRSFVEKVHALGMKVMTWYSVPFIGERSENFSKYGDMLIDPESSREWHVLDPRYPQVREFIIRTYEQALDAYDLDGFKLDFVDEFVVTPFSGKPVDERRDFLSVAHAADFLLKECIRRLKEKNPELLVEFRQTYNGPLMRSYGNIFRAVDCPLDHVENHRRVTDIRLLSGNSAVHSDMLMWHCQDSPQSAALQIIQILFSVPQISVRLEKLSQEHRKVLAFYCGLWKKYQNAFVKGSFCPLNPIQGYSVIMGAWENQLAVTCHGREIIPLEKLWEEMVFVNGSCENRLILDSPGREEEYEIRVYDCMGTLVRTEKKTINQGIFCCQVPRSGTAVFTMKVRDSGCAQGRLSCPEA